MWGEEVYDILCKSFRVANETERDHEVHSGTIYANLHAHYSVETISVIV